MSLLASAFIIGCGQPPWEKKRKKVQTFSSGTALAVLADNGHTVTIQPFDGSTHDRVQGPLVQAIDGYPATIFFVDGQWVDYGAGEQNKLPLSWKTITWRIFDSNVGRWKDLTMTQ